MKMKSSIYDILKYIQRIFIPAIVALYATLAGIWGWPCGEQILGTLTAIDVCVGALSVVDVGLGAFLEVSSAAYHRIEIKPEDLEVDE